MSCPPHLGVSRERSSQQGRTEGEKGGNCSSIGRAACCDKANMKKGPWSPEEDAKLKSYIEQRGTGGKLDRPPQKIGVLSRYSMSSLFPCADQASSVAARPAASGG
ncbi:hypothetical protein B296_00045729 [Ensete ventricosum]|uniref:Uncharacterized protein n=1 Tax=Ensete ventricosum TaxID=4639 RepID=A0A426Y8H0_ENSVE|nr:hypothetical protein B296_00045729 [Ensete ventricosum]